MSNRPQQGKGKFNNSGTSANGERLRSLECQIRSVEFQELAAAVLACYEGELEKAHLEQLKQMVEEKPKFGYWTVSEAEYDREYSFAMELGRLQVFKGSVSADREQYQLVRHLHRQHPTLVGLNLLDCRRQFMVFLSPRAEAMRLFALVEMATQADGENSILL